MAPELFKDDTRHNEKVDIWAIVCLCYYLLFRQFPFAEKSGKFNQALVLEGAPDFRLNNFRRLSPSALTFIKSGLVKDSSKRPTAKMMLNHPWLRGE